MGTSTDLHTLDDVEPADSTGSARDRLGAWLAARPLEVIGVSVVLAGSVLATVLVLWSTTQRPTELPPAAGVGNEVLAHDVHAGAAPDDASATGTHTADSVDHGVGASGTSGASGASGTSGTSGASGASGEVIVHVSGAVHRAGVVTLPAGSRVADAVIAVGGATDDADLDLVNLARLLTDAEQVHVPRIGEEPPGHVVGGAAAPPAGDGRIDVNRASAAELESLPGIGPARARAIISYREEHGPFGVPGDLRAVSGIGEATFQNLADRIRVG